MILESLCPRHDKEEITHFIRLYMRKARVYKRPYVLRAYFDTDYKKIIKDYKTFKPRKIIIDYETKPLRHEKTIQQLIQDLKKL